MGWSLDLLEMREPALCEAVLLAAGKALFLANAFEEKCKFVLRIANLESHLEDNPVASLTHAIASLARDKMLGRTIVDLAKFSQVSQEDVETLERARDARNFIAHQGELFGSLSGARRRVLEEHAERLRAEVDLLARGDNVVSQWVYEIEEKDCAPQHFASAYSDIVRNWVFGHLDDGYSHDSTSSA